MKVPLLDLKPQYQSLKKEIASVESVIGGINIKMAETDKEIRVVMTDIQKIEDMLKIKKQREEQLKNLEEKQKLQSQKLEELRTKLNSLGTNPI